MSESYCLVWEDNFSKNGFVDPEKWIFELGHGHLGWGNNELQIYKSEQTNCRIKNGKLHINAVKESDGTYSSARIHSYSKASWTYGRIELSAKLPTGKGTWPAVWMLGDAFQQGIPWPLCGEIDIMEHVGRDPERIHFSLHTAAYNHKIKTQITDSHLVPGVLSGFHTYRMDWDKSGFEFYIDNNLMSQFKKGEKTTVEQWPFDRPFHLILNVAIGGNWGGDVDDSALPTALEIEYVRVYQKTKRREE